MGIIQGLLGSHRGLLMFNYESERKLKKFQDIWRKKNFILKN